MNTFKLKQLFEKSNDKYADSKAIGTTYQTMYNIIYKDSICKVDLLEKIAKFYKVPVGYFFDEEKYNGKIENTTDFYKQEEIFFENKPTSPEEKILLLVEFNKENIVKLDLREKVLRILNE